MTNIGINPLISGFLTHYSGVVSKTCILSFVLEEIIVGSARDRSLEISEETEYVKWNFRNMIHRKICIVALNIFCLYFCF